MTTEITENLFLEMVVELAKVDKIVYGNLSVVEGNYHRLSESAKAYIDQQLGINRIISVRYLYKINVQA